MLSGEQLIDNKERRDALLAQFPDAKGGEMEGAGVYAACYRRGVHWILVKSICDFADGQKADQKEQKQALAIDTAVSACLALFNDPNVFSSFGVEVFEEMATFVRPQDAPQDVSGLEDPPRLIAHLHALLDEQQQNGIADILAQIKNSGYRYDGVKMVSIQNQLSPQGIALMAQELVQSTKALINSIINIQENKIIPENILTRILTDISVDKIAPSLNELLAYIQESDLREKIETFISEEEKLHINPYGHSIASIQMDKNRLLENVKGFCREILKMKRQ
jgi:hypothetical protein